MKLPIYQEWYCPARVLPQSLLLRFVYHNCHYFDPQPASFGFQNLSMCAKGTVTPASVMGILQQSPFQSWSAEPLCKSIARFLPGKSAFAILMHHKQHKCITKALSNILHRPPISLEININIKGHRLLTSTCEQEQIKSSTEVGPYNVQGQTKQQKTELLLIMQNHLSVTCHKITVTEHVTMHLSAYIHVLSLHLWTCQVIALCTVSSHFQLVSIPSDCYYSHLNLMANHHLKIVGWCETKQHKSSKEVNNKG